MMIEDDLQVFRRSERLAAKIMLDVFGFLVDGWVLLGESIMLK